MNMFQIEPTILDERHYSSGRAERHQKTSPTLPPGAPIPDNDDPPPASMLNQYGQSPGTGQGATTISNPNLNHTLLPESHALTLFREGEHCEHLHQYQRAAHLYHQALHAMAREKHDPKFHLQVEIALSRVRAKGGIRQ